MQKFISFLENKFAPPMNKFAENTWIKIFSDGIMLALPTIFLGSLISIYNILRTYVPGIPNIDPIYQFSFGLYSLILAFLIAYQGMSRLEHTQYKLCAGIISISTFLMILNPVIDKGIISFEFSRFGPKGMLVAFLAGLFAIIIMHTYAKIDPFKNAVSTPEFILKWLNQVIPTFVALFIAMLVIYTFKIDIFNVVNLIFSPISSFGQTLPGFIIICFTPALLYSLGISSWLLSPVYTPIMLQGINANIEAVNAGLMPMNIVTQETIFLAFIWIGGMGATLPLVLMMLKAKTIQLRTIAKVSLVPSLFNINEPVIFGTPIAFNPYLMPAMWINGIVGPIITWFFMKGGLVNIPAKLLTGVKIPMPISSVLATEDWRAIILWVILFAVYTVVWYPFFKLYDNIASKKALANLEGGVGIE